MSEPRKKSEALYLDLIKEVDSLLIRIERLKKATPIDAKTLNRFIIVSIISNLIIVSSVFFIFKQSENNSLYIEAGKMFNERFSKLNDHDKDKVLNLLEK